MTTLVLFILVLVGLLTYIFSNAGKIVEIGRILFWVALLAFLLRFSAQSVNLFHGG